MPDSAEKRKNKCLQDAAFFLGAAVLVCLLVYKAFHSVGDEDESLFIFNAFRFAKGDRFLVDDWHVSQLSAVFLYLPVKIFYAAVGSCDGIVLFSRLLFVASQALVTAFTYAHLRKFGYAGVLSSLMFLFNIPLCFLMVLYYNSLLCLFLECLAVVIAMAVEKATPVKAVLCGIFFGATVICSPYCIFVFIAYTAVTVIQTIRRRKRSDIPVKASSLLFTPKFWVGVCGGIAVTAALFILLIMKNNSLSEIIRNLPMVFYDNEYTSGLLSGFRDIFSDLLSDISFLIKAGSWASAMFFAILFLSLAFDKKRKEHKNIYLIVCTAWYTVYFIFVFSSGKLQSHLSYALPFAIVSSVCLILIRSKYRTQLLALFFSGFIFSALRSLESDMNIMAGLSILPVCTVAAALIIAAAAVETSASKSKTGKAAAAALCAVLVFQLSSQVYINLQPKSYSEYYYGLSGSDEQMNVLLTDGPMKHLKTTAKAAELYNGTLEDLDTIKETAEGPLMVPKEVDWIYMYLDELPIGTYSGYLVCDDWRSFCNEKMKLYYEYHPEKYPEYIYIPYYNGCLASDSAVSEGMLDDIVSSYNCSAVNGKYGYIVEVSR